MAIRKIPMKEQPYLSDSSTLIRAAVEDDHEPPEDPQVNELTSKIRKTLLTDRGKG